MAPFTVGENSPLHHAFALFRQLGLRHLVVTDGQNRPVGVLTRKSLMPWRTPVPPMDDNDTFVGVREAMSPLQSPSASPSPAVLRRQSADSSSPTSLPLSSSDSSDQHSPP